MAQRILEPGQIETLAQRSIPRIRPPDRRQLFSRRAARLRQLASNSAIGDYLRFAAVLADAQQAAIERLPARRPDTVGLERAAERRLAPLHPSIWPRAPDWRDTLEHICAAVADPRLPPAVGA